MGTRAERDATSRQPGTNDTGSEHGAGQAEWLQRDDGTRSGAEWVQGGRARMYSLHSRRADPLCLAAWLGRRVATLRLRLG